ncbi:GlsB/YeaQ/YmgE family stress response membrane protein [Catenovulum sp. 2E275]|uniref:GlsB/YeaQ/YmgE family stress response membrane protein n=1 Tax=Catenovulum sp. 2E275 TaxID=2980497 RepID=UPI0021D1B131|nr:GlsB/YeaQ/YmgE family stress response membrane protein [Catenovulum sp. 2E275]MCU4674521.1 GlsB/YeaQ/YmgE family stress response membrane protein [Catenovulum sp. 2E275]
MSLITFLIIGALAGWLAGQLTKGQGFGILGNIVIGIVGSIIGGFTFGLLGFSSNNLIGSIIMATVGAIILLYIVRLAKK